MLLNAAGLRSDPPVSLPSAIGTMPVVSAAAAPPLLPPTVFTRLYGLCVAPNTGLKVFDPAPNSGVFVLPSVIAPAARMRVTISASTVGTLSLNNGEPNVVRIPAVGTRSLWATGSPCSGPSFAPRACASSAALAPAIARSATSVTIALTRGFTRSMRLRCAAITSRAETSLRRMRAVSSTALRLHSSSPVMPPELGVSEGMGVLLRPGVVRVERTGSTGNAPPSAAAPRSWLKARRERGSSGDMASGGDRKWLGDYPPAIAPITRYGSSPHTTSSGSTASGDSCDKSSSHAKNRMKSRRFCVT